MLICGQNFSDKTIGRIRATILEQPSLSRTQLSMQVCEWLDWRSDNGKLKEVSSRVALLKLERIGLLTLPPVQKIFSRSYAARDSVDDPSPTVDCDLSGLGAIDVVPIKEGDAIQSRLWNEMMNRHHYLGAGPLCGAQIRYFIQSEREGIVGGFAFSSAAWRVTVRDQWIGWDEKARRQNLHRVVNNSRFVILRHLRVKNLASYALSLVIRRVSADWLERYGFSPVLLETFVDTERFHGTSYRAANFLAMGATQGRGRQDRSHAYDKSQKAVYLYPLCRNVRETLCGERPSVVACERPVADWAEEEFGGVVFSDKRMRKRLLTLSRDFYARPQADIPEACCSRAKAKAAYRFFDHDETTMDEILKPHYESTLKRMQKESVVLAVQDTTTLNYSMHPAMIGQGTIGSSKEGAMGLLVHDTMVFNTEGTPLGLLDVQSWARDPKSFGKKHRRHALPIEEKESYKWLTSFKKVIEAQRACPTTRIVSVGDRESDIYELFQLACNEKCGLLVRAEQDRLLAEGQVHLWERVSESSVAGVYEVHIPRRNGHPARNAKLEVRYARVELSPPQNKRELGNLFLYAVLASEIDVAEGLEPLSWMLLTTVSVNCFEEAVERVKWYGGRWGIEVYHRTLKSGCKIEERRLGSAERIESCLAIDMVVAWRIFYLTKLGRETPDVPCTVFFEDAEWKALVAYKTRDASLPKKVPTLREAIRMVASLGGFLGRKGDGEPGTKSLWIGLQRLDDITEGWTVAVSMYAPHLLSHTTVSSTDYG